jgi:zinc protease
VNIWYHVGSRNEKRGKTGFAHLFEHFFFNGSENYPHGFREGDGRPGRDQPQRHHQHRPHQLLRRRAGVGARAHPVPGIDRMGFLGNYISRPMLERERGVVQNEKRQGENQPYGQVWDKLTRSMYPEGHPYHHSVIGSMNDLNAASLEDVKNWFRTWYGPNNAVLVLAGDIDVATAKEKVARYFGDIPAGPSMAQPKVDVAIAREVHARNHDRPCRRHASTAPGTSPRPAPPTRPAAAVRAGAGRGKSSRLDQRLLHQEKLVDNISAGAYSSQLGSKFVIMATVKQGVDPAKVEAIIDEEVRRLVKDGPTAEELSRGKTAFRAGFIRGIERIGGFGGKADALAEGQVFHGDPNAWKTSYERVLAATPANLTAAGRQWLTDGSYSLNVLPFPDYAASATGVDRSRMPTPQPAPLANFPEIEHATLSNGLKVMFVPRTAVPTVSMNLIFDAGSAVDPVGQQGAAVLTSTVLTNGTDDLDALEISDRLQILGATLGASSGVNATTVSMTAIESRLAPSLALFADVVRNPAFRPDDFQRGRAQQISVIQQANRSPGAIANRVLSAQLYGPENPYGRSPSGTEATVGALTPEQLRAYHDAWFRPDNATLVVVGDTTLAELQPQLERAFAGWRAPATALSARPETPALPAAPATPRVLIVDRAGPQSIITGGRIAPAFDARTQAAIETMNSALGGAFTSRINMNLREDKHWSYGASGGIRTARGDRAYVVTAGVQADKTAESLVELRRELTDVVGSRPLTEAELAATRANLVQGLAGEWETNAAVVGDMARMVTYGLPEDFYDSYAAGVTATTPEAAAAAARSVVGAGPTTWVIVGDRAQIEPKVRALGFGDVQVVDLNGQPVQ